MLADWSPSSNEDSEDDDTVARGGNGAAASATLASGDAVVDTHAHSRTILHIDMCDINTSTHVLALMKLTAQCITCLCFPGTAFMHK